MQHPTGARSPDLVMARQVSDAALVDARVIDPHAPIRPRPPAAPAVPAIPAPAGVGRASADVVRASFARRSGQILLEGLVSRLSPRFGEFEMSRAVVLSVDRAPSTVGQSSRDPDWRPTSPRVGVSPKPNPGPAR